MYRLRPKEYCMNKLKWNSEGKKMACGDINGCISIISADKEVTLNRFIMQSKKIFKKWKN